MINNFNEEAAKKIIYDDEKINVTETNPLKELGKVCVQLLLIGVVIYFSIFIGSGIVLATLSPENQVKLEKVLSGLSKPPVAKIDDKERLLALRDNILKLDKDFPKTANLDINVIDAKAMNAFCYPNGNIYITSSLYNRLKTDEQITFLLAHEMGHYKYRDHLQALRRNLANSIVLILLSATGGNDQRVRSMFGGSLNISDLKYSRKAEERADKYAIKVTTSIYGNADAGVELMEILKEQRGWGPEFLSTHPNIEKRIKYIRKNSTK